MPAVMDQAFKPLWGVLNAKEAHLAGKWAIGASGAVGTKTGGLGLKLTRTGAGAYTVQLQSGSQTDARAVAILHADVTVWVNDTDPTNDTDGHYAKHKLITDSAGTFTFQCQDEAGVVREAPSGAVISIFVVVKLSGV